MQRVQELQLITNFLGKTTFTSTTRRFAIKIKKLFKMRDMSPETLESIYLQGILPSALSVWGMDVKFNWIICTVELREWFFKLMIKYPTLMCWNLTIESQLTWCTRVSRHVSLISGLKMMIFFLITIYCNLFELMHFLHRCEGIYATMFCTT